MSDSGGPIVRTSRAAGIKVNDPRVACIGDVERFIGGDVEAPRRV